MPTYRRTLLKLAPFAFSPSLAAQATTPVPSGYPAHTPALAREMVGVSHRDIQRVRELLKARPELAKASWDWGFGDWETALGAASHTGNRAIAELLIESGAPPTLFSAAMLGQLEVVKALVEASPGAQRIPGPHSISLLDHARAGGERAKPVFEYLQGLGDAGSPAASPLSEEAKTSILLGVYGFGSGAQDRIEITGSGKPHVELKLGDSDVRRLFHLGELTFYPVGARAVRIRFDGKGGLTIHDGPLVLTAKRTGEVSKP